MGYTHYFGFKVNDKVSILEKKYQQAIKDCQKVIQYIYKKEGIPLSGYSVHTKIGHYGGLNFNGKGNDQCEDFYLREHFAQNMPTFCKTRQLPYDIAVTACLAILKYRLKDAFEVDSDGNTGDFVEGTEIARKVLKRKILNPIQNGLIVVK